MNKAEFIAKLREEQMAWEQFVYGYTPEQHVQPNAVGIWSIKDVVAHVAMWERYATAMVRAHVRKTPPSPHEMWGLNIPSSELADDSLNEWCVAQTAKWTMGEALGMQREVRAQMMAAVQTLSDEDLTDPKVAVAGFSWKGDQPLWHVLAEMSYKHAHTHRANIRKMFTPDP